MKILKLSLASIAVSTTLFAGNYNVDASHTNAGFTVKHMMITNVTGKFNDIAGTFEFDEKTNTLKSINGEIIVASINTANEKRDEHLKAEDMFDVAKFQKITFKSTKIEGNSVYGDFTMKGVTKSIKLELENGGTVTDPWGKQRAGFELEGKINRKDFGITWNKVLETGGVAVGEEVKLKIAIEGILAK
jgi:polyisoprenoid-binding protein YceI